MTYGSLHERRTILDQRGIFFLETDPGLVKQGPEKLKFKKFTQIDKHICYRSSSVARGSSKHWGR